ncbi:hypothetical protein E0H70_21140 [Rhizobium leguminosarum bv. viciae]|nr:hypothetical protein E0H70_21140 [Rhizobium leguminosarum bv. viciae]
MSIDEEIEQIDRKIENLSTFQQTPTRDERIEHFRALRVQLCRRSEKYFQPFRDEDGVLITSHHGDTEFDF